MSLAEDRERELYKTKYTEASVLLLRIYDAMKDARVGQCREDTQLSAIFKILKEEFGDKK